MIFDQMNDAELAKHINAGIAELKARHAKQQADLAKKNAAQLADAMASDKAKKPGRKPRVLVNAA